MPPIRESDRYTPAIEELEGVKRIAVMAWKQSGGEEAFRGLGEAVTLIFRRTMDVVGRFSLLGDAETDLLNQENLPEMVKRHKLDIVTTGSIEIENDIDVSLKLSFWRAGKKPRGVRAKGLMRDMAGMLYTLIENFLSTIGVKIDPELRAALKSGFPVRSEIIFAFGHALTEEDDEAMLETLTFIATEDEKFSLPLLVLAELYAETDPRRTEDYLIEAVEADPYDPQSYILLSNFISRQYSHRNREALDVLDDCFEIAPFCGDAHHAAGILLNNLNKPEAAVDHLEIAATLLPGNTDVLNDYATALWKNFEDYEKAIEIYEIIIGINPLEPIYQANMAGVLADLHREEHAIKFAISAARLTGQALEDEEVPQDFKEKLLDDYLSYCMLGAEIAHYGEDDDTALDLLEKVLEVDSSHHMARLLKQTIERKY